MPEIKKRTDRNDVDPTDYKQAIADLKLKVESLEKTRTVVIVVATIFGISGAFGSWVLGRAWSKIEDVSNASDGIEKRIQAIDSTVDKTVAAAAQRLGLVLAHQGKLWIEAGQTKKDVEGTLSVSFKQAFIKEPVVVATGLWEGAGAAAVAQSITSINTDRFMLAGGNASGKGHDYYVTWIAIGQR